MTQALLTNEPDIESAVPLRALREGLIRELKALHHQADAKKQQIAAVEKMLGLDKRPVER